MTAGDLLKHLVFMKKRDKSHMDYTIKGGSYCWHHGKKTFSIETLKIDRSEKSLKPLRKRKGKK
jgi:hypothetical protein